jgi:Tol biopolymer transport system component
MRWRACAASGALISIAFGCADILGIDDGIPRPGLDVSVDAPFDAAGDAPADGPKAACNLASPFGTPVALGSLNTSAVEQHPRLSPDELDVTFQRNVVDAGWDLFAASRAEAGASFSPPAPIAELDTPNNDVDLSESPDGLRAFFCSDRPGGLGGYDVWQASRAARTDPFGALAPIGNVNSTSNDHETYYVPGALYLVSNRGSGAEDIYRASEQSGGFASPLLIAELSSPAYDGYPVVTTDELSIYFASTRGDAGVLQPYTATRATAAAPWDAPTLVTELAVYGNVLPGWISPDGCRFYFSSDENGDYDLFVASKAP